jgi:hypothetical protein
VIAVSLLLALVPIAWIVLRRPLTPRGTELQVAATSLWMLDHFCISLGAVLREWPELREIRLSLAQLTQLDEASIASLKRAIQTAHQARVRFCVDGYDASMARQALRGGIDAEHLGVPRALAPTFSQWIH